MALIDELKAKLKNVKPAGSTGPTIGSSAISSAIAAKEGRAAQPGAPIASNQLEASAVNQARAQTQSLQGQANLQAEQLNLQQSQQTAQDKAAKSALSTNVRMEEQEQASKFAAAQSNLNALRNMSTLRLSAEKEASLKAMSHKAKQALQDLASDRKTTTENLFTNFRMENADLAQRKDAFQLQQTAAAMALSNEKYITQINRIGAENNLHQQIEFDKEALRIELGNAFDSLVDNINWAAEFSERQREFEKQMGVMSNNDAYKIAMSAIEQQNKQQIANGIIQGAGVAVKAYQASPTTPPTNPNAGQFPTVDAPPDLNIGFDNNTMNQPAGAALPPLGGG